MESENDVGVLGSQLRAARETVALSIEEAARLAGISPDDLEKWERDDEDPPIETLWSLASHYSRPTDFFLRPVQVRPSQIAYRITKGDSLSRLSLETRQTIARFEELCRYEAELEALAGRGVPVAFEPTDVRDSEHLAEHLRGPLGLGPGPISDLRRSMEGAGIRVFELPMKEDNVAGVSWWHDELGPCVLVNSRDHPTRRNFSLAHELGHLARTRAASVCDLEVETQDEQLANGFAANLTMPAWDFVQQFELNQIDHLSDWDQLARLVRRYNIGPEAVGLRAEELRLLPNGSVSRLRHRKPYQTHFRRGKRPAWKRQLGARYTSVAYQTYEAGQISLGRLARYLGLELRAAREAVENGQLSADWA